MLALYVCMQRYVYKYILTLCYFHESSAHSAVLFLLLSPAFCIFSLAPAHLWLQRFQGGPCYEHVLSLSHTVDKYYNINLRPAIFLSSGPYLDPRLRLPLLAAPLPLLWLLLPALHLSLLPAQHISLPGRLNALPCASVPAEQQGTNVAWNGSDILCSAQHKEDSIPQLQEVMALLAGTVESSSSGDTTDAVEAG